MMMKFKNIALVLAVIQFSLPATAQTRKVELKGTITGLAGREVAIFDITAKNKLATATGKGDSFILSLEVKQDESIPYFLNVPAMGGFGPSMKIPYFMLFLDAPKLAVTATIKGDRLELSSVKGSHMMDEYKKIDSENKYNALLAQASKEYHDAFELYNTKKEQSEENRKRLSKTSDSLDVLYRKKASDFVSMINKYPTSKALAFYVSNSFGRASVAKKKELIASFDPAIHASYPLAKLAESILVEEKSAVGQPLPDFNVYDQNGKLDRLSNYKGQYLLIDFWASWCGPCIKEIPNLKSVYADYKDKGLKLIGISVDESLDKWKKAIEELGLTNLQLNDKDNLTGKLLNYQGIPFIILVSPEGKIIARDIRGENIRKKVAQYLD